MELSSICCHVERRTRFSSFGQQHLPFIIWSISKRKIQTAICIYIDWLIVKKKKQNLVMANETSRNDNFLSVSLTLHIIAETKCSPYEF